MIQAITIHQDLTNPAIYAHLRGDDIALLREAVQDRTNWNPLLSVLVQFGSEAAERQFIDREAIYMLGRSLNRILPAELKRLVVLNVRTMPEAVRTPFSKGVNFSSERRNRPAPLKVELDRLTKSLQSAPEQIFQDRIRSFHSRQLTFVEQTGFDADFVRASMTLAKLLLRRGESARVNGARLAQEIVRDAVVWRPEKPSLWLLWARGLVTERAYHDAEELLWNLIRRFPDEPRFRLLLARVLLSMADRNAEALALARENVALLHGAAEPEFHLAEALSRTGVLDDSREAIAILARHTSPEKLYYVATGLIARILVDATARFPVPTEMLFPDFPSVIFEGSVAAAALQLAPTSPVARDIYRHMLGVDPHAARTRNNLAKALTASDDPDDAIEAEAILRENLASDPGDRFAAGLLVGILRSRGEQDWHEQALRILGDVQDAQPDRSVETQIATLLSIGNETQRAEARDILERLHAEDPADSYVRLALARWHLANQTDDMQEQVARLMQPLASDAGFKRVALGLLRDAGIAEPVAEEQQEHARESEIANMIGETGKAGIQAEITVPLELRRLGRLRRARFLQEHGLIAEDDDAAGTEPANSTESTYLNVLKARGGEQIDDDIAQGTFQVALELAVYNKSPGALDALAKTFPKFLSIILLAKAIIGDRMAQSVVNSMLKQPNSEDPVARVVVSRLGRIAKDSLDFVERKFDLAQGFHDLNEMTLRELMAA